MKLSFMIDRPPGSALRGKQDSTCALDLGIVRTHRFNDRTYLRRMNAPHSEESEAGSSEEGVLTDRRLVAQCQRDVMDRHNTIGQRCRNNLGFGSYQQWVLEL